MPNIQGDYSPREVAMQLNVSTAWINKLQREAGIPRAISTKGSEVIFDSHDLCELRSAYVLRTLDYSFKEIRYMYKLEKGLVEFVYKHNLIKEPQQISNSEEYCKCCLYIDRRLPVSKDQDGEQLMPSVLTFPDSESEGKPVGKEVLDYVAGLKELTKIQQGVTSRIERLKKRLEFIAKRMVVSENTWQNEK